MDIAMGGSVESFQADQRIILESISQFESQANNYQPIEPEYEGSLDSLIVNLNQPDQKDGYSQSLFLWHDIISILKTLPKSARPKVLIKKGGQSFLQKNTPEDILERLDILEVSRNPGPWSRDYAKVGKKRIVLPLGIYGAKPSDFSNQFIREVATMLKKEVTPLPVYFDGGNLFISENQLGRRYLFVGSTDFLHTEQLYKNAGLYMDELVYKDYLKRAFIVDEVVILGLRDQNGFLQKQPNHYYHIDLLMLPISRGKVLVQSIRMIEEYAGEIYSPFANLVRKILDQNGFDIIKVEATPGEYENSQSFTNNLAGS